MIRVVVVDDHLFYREGVAALLAGFDDVEVVGEATHGDEVMGVVADTRPDVVLLDLGLPGRSGLALLPEILERWLTVAVVVTMDDDDSSIRAALHRGAAGYLLKDATAAELHRALTAPADGRFTLSASLAPRLPGLVAGAGSRPLRDGIVGLTPRELVLLGHLAEGRTNEEIARHLDVAPKTIRNQLSLLYTKLAVTDRSRAALLARDLGYGTH